MNKTKKNNWGGARKGAGRPRKTILKTNIPVSNELETDAYLDLATNSIIYGKNVKPSYFKAQIIVDPTATGRPDFTQLLSYTRAVSTIGAILTRLATHLSYIEIEDKEKLKEFVSRENLILFGKDLISIGNLFIEKVRNNSGKLAKYKRIDPRRINIAKENGKLEYRYYEFPIQNNFIFNTEKYIVIPNENILHITLPSQFSSIWGEGALMLLESKVLQLMDADTVINASFQNRGRLEGVLRDPRPNVNYRASITNKDGEKQTKAEAIQAAWRNNLQGPERSNQVVFIGPLEYQTIQAVNKDMMLDYVIELNKKYIYEAFGISEAMMGSSSNQNYANSRIQFSILNNIVFQYRDILIEKLNEDLQKELGLKIVFETKIPSDPSFEAEIETKKATANQIRAQGDRMTAIKTINEIRKEYGLKEIDEDWANLPPAYAEIKIGNSKTTNMTSENPNPSKKDDLIDTQPKKQPSEDNPRIDEKEENKTSTKVNKKNINKNKKQNNKIKIKKNKLKIISNKKLDILEKKFGEAWNKDFENLNKTILSTLPKKREALNKLEGLIENDIITDAIEPFILQIIDKYLNGQNRKQKLIEAYFGSWKEIYKELGIEYADFDSFIPKLQEQTEFRIKEIDETTRKTIQKKLFDLKETNVFEMRKELANFLKNEKKSRIEMIQRSEISNMNNYFREDEIMNDETVKYKKNIDAGDAKVSEICKKNTRAGAILKGEKFPSGHLRPPFHPNCRCVVVPAIED